MSSRDPASTADDEALHDDFQKRAFGFIPRARRPLAPWKPRLLPHPLDGCERPSRQPNPERR